MSRIALVLVVGELLACKSGPKQKCVSSVQVGSERYSSLGTHSDKAKARESSVIGACIAYCQFGDPTVKAAFDQWKRDNPSSPAKPDSIITIHLQREVKACQSRCDAQTRSGAATLRTECL